MVIPISGTVAPIAHVRASRVAVFSRGICRGLNGWIHIGGHIGGVRKSSGAHSILGVIRFLKSIGKRVTV